MSFRTFQIPSIQQFTDVTFSCRSWQKFAWLVSPRDGCVLCTL